MAVASVLNLRAFCTPFLVEEEGMVVRRKLIKFLGIPGFLAVRGIREALRGSNCGLDFLFFF